MVIWRHLLYYLFFTLRRDMNLFTLNPLLVNTVMSTF